MKVPFNYVFEIKPDGSITPKQQTRVGMVTLSPGVFFGEGVSFGGIDFSKFKGRYLEIETDENIIVIKGIY